MSKHCATCTCVFESGQLDADQLLDVLTNGTPHRHVYRGAYYGSDRWFITYSGGEAEAQAVRTLSERGAIHLVYDEVPDCYHVGKTLDMKAFREANKGSRKKDPRISVYTDGTHEVGEWK